jgi:hypothetical protein
MTRDKKDLITKWSIITIFVGLYILTSVVSTIHVIDFFRLSNPNWLAVTLAIAFEIGAAASLGAIIILDKTNKTMVWLLFGTITSMQMMGNMFYAYVHLEGFQGWSELFGLIEEDVIFQKRILSIVSGAILPLVALGFIKSLVDYIKPEKNPDINSEKMVQDEPIILDTLDEKQDQPEENLEPPFENVPENSSLNTSEEFLKSDEIETTGDFSQLLKDLDSKLSKKEELKADPELTPEEMEANTIIEETSTKPRGSDFLSGYYGDIEINDSRPGVKTDESEILPVNSNKRNGYNESSQVFISPTKL